MKKLIAGATLLVVAIWTVHVAWSPKFCAHATAPPNSYNAQVIAASYDPGTQLAAFTVQWTGSMSGAGSMYHYPQGSGHVKGYGDPTWTGQATLATSNMNQTHTFYLPLQYCNATDLDEGLCEGDTQPGVYCPVYYGLFVSFFRKIQFEYAFTYTNALGGNGKGGYVETPHCTAPTTPPDYAASFDDQPDQLQYLNEAVMYRFATYGQPYTGQQWFPLWKVGNHVTSTIAPGNCTKFDAGYHDPADPPPAS